MVHVATASTAPRHFPAASAVDLKLGFFNARSQRQPASASDIALMKAASVEGGCFRISYGAEMLPGYFALVRLLASAICLSSSPLITAWINISSVGTSSCAAPTVIVGLPFSSSSGRTPIFGIR